MLAGLACSHGMRNAMSLEIPCAISTTAMDDLESPGAEQARPARGTIREAARPDRRTRRPQIPGQGVRRHASRRYPAQHRFPEIALKLQNLLNRIN
jgi:hypothetical protein